MTLNDLIILLAGQEYARGGKDWETCVIWARARALEACDILNGRKNDS